MSNHRVKIWLALCCCLIYLMIVIGGVTRLTDSGLSMVTWKPVVGAIPPLTHDDWNEEFLTYQQFPEYQSKPITLSQFKRIFLWEYIHRLLGRLIGLVFFLPLLYFAFTRQIKKSSFGLYFALFILGALQGLLGWYMVKSGLINNPQVSQYRLVAHLSLAVVIYSILFWHVITTSKTNLLIKPNPLAKARAFSIAIVLLIGVMIVSGGFMAGTKAGHVFNTYPKMNGEWIPSQIFVMQPLWKNLFENVVAIQFVHRSLAIVIILLIIYFYFHIRKSRDVVIRKSSNILLGMGLLQILLGITTLLLKVPVFTAVLHQAGAVVLLSCALYTLNKLSYSAKIDYT